MSYQSDTPVRFQAKGLLDDSEVKRFFNPAPLYPAGIGQTVISLSHHKRVNINKAQVVVSSGNGEIFFTVPVAVEMHWNGSPSQNWREPAEWVRIMLNLKQGAGPREQPSKAHSKLYWILQLAVVLVGVFIAWWIESTPKQISSHRDVANSDPVAAE